MAEIPLRPNLKRYMGSKPELQRRAAAQNAMAQKIADYVNRRMAVNPSEIQQYLFADIGREVGASADDVRAAISDGGHNGITLGVRGEARRALAQCEPKAGDPIRIRPTIAGKTEIDRIAGTITSISDDRISTAPGCWKGRL